MKMQTRLLAILIIAIVAFLFAYLLFGMSPPKASNELIIRKGGDSSWSLSNEQNIYGKSIWSQFATHPNNETIKLYHCTYQGGILVNKDTMFWEDETGSFSSKPLSLDDLMARWQDLMSVFKFKYENEYYTVSFAIPKLENGTYKYTDLSEAWKRGELYQIIEGW